MKFDENFIKSGFERKFCNPDFLGIIIVIISTIILCRITIVYHTYIKETIPRNSPKLSQKIPSGNFTYLRPDPAIGLGRFDPFQSFHTERRGRLRGWHDPSTCRGG